MGQPTARIFDSTFVSNLDLHKPQVLNTLFSPFGDQGSAYLMIRSLGFETPVMGDTYKHAEEDMYHSTFKQQTGTAVGDPGAGNDITLTLDTTKVDVDGYFYPRVHDQITFPNETQGWIRTITTTPGAGFGGGLLVTVVVRPNQILKSCGAVAAGAELAITSGLFSEGSGMPDPAVNTVSWYDNDAQIIKEAIGVTGTELVNETWIDSFNVAGEFQGYYRQGQAALDHRVLLKIDGMFWVGERVDNTASRGVDPVTNRVYKGSEGLIPFLRRKGNISSYTHGAYSITDFDSYGLTLERNYVSPGTPNWMPMGSSLFIEAENELKGYLDNTNVQFAKTAVNDVLFHGDDSLSASVNFKYFVKNNRTFLWSTLPGFNSPVTFGATGYKFNQLGFVIPLEKRKEPTTKNDIPSIGMRYRAMGSLNRRMITDTLSGIGATIKGIPVNTIDASNTYSMVHMGNEFFGGNRMILITP